jgi:hypothetical protein
VPSVVNLNIWWRFWSLHFRRGENINSILFMDCHGYDNGGICGFLGFIWRGESRNIIK